MTMTSTTVSNNGGSNGVFGNLVSEIGSGIGSTVKEFLPIWTAQQLNLQRKDQLNDDVYTGDHSKNLTNPSNTTASTAPPSQNFFDKYQTPLLITGGLTVLAVIVLAIK